MKTTFKMKKLAVCTAFAIMAAAPLSSATAAQLGDLTDGAVHVGSVTGYWSLFANAGDYITVTGLRLEAFDPWAVAWVGHIDPPTFPSPGIGSAIAWGDDNISGNNYLGGGYGDPQFSFTAASTGEYTVGVFRCCGDSIEGLHYSVEADGSTAAAIPEPETYAMLLAGLGLLGFVARRRQRKLAAA